MGIPTSRGADFCEWLAEVLPELSEQIEIGITKQAIANGYESLSEKQRYVMENNVVAPNVVHECKYRGCELTWDEMHQAVNGDGYCSSCRHDLQRYVWNDDHSKDQEQENEDRIFGEILLAIMEAGADENAEKIGVLANQILKIAKSGLRPEELFATAPQTAFKKLEEASSLFRPTELSEDIQLKIQNHSESFIRGMDSFINNLVLADSPDLRAHAAGPALLEFFQSQKRTIDRETFSQAMIKFHQDFRDSMANFAKDAKQVYEFKRISDMGLASLEYGFNTFVSVLAALAEHPYKSLLKIALELTQMSRGIPKKIPSMLGPIMESCEILWREGHGPIILLDDRARIIRNSSVHGSVKFDTENNAVSFMDKGTVVLGPWRRELFEFYADFTGRWKAMTTAFSMIRWT